MKIKTENQNNLKKSEQKEVTLSPKQEKQMRMLRLAMLVYFYILLFAVFLNFLRPDALMCAAFLPLCLVVMFYYLALYGAFSLPLVLIVYIVAKHFILKPEQGVGTIKEKNEIK